MNDITQLPAPAGMAQSGEVFGPQVDLNAFVEEFGDGLLASLNRSHPPVLTTRGGLAVIDRGMGAVERGQQAIAKLLHEGVEVHLRPEDLARLRHAGRRRQLSAVVHVRLLVHKKTADTPLPWRVGKARRGEWRPGRRSVLLWQ